MLSTHVWYTFSFACSVKLLLDQILFENLPKDVAALPSRVLSSLSNVKLLDMMDPKYKKFSTVSSASSLRVILATSVPWLMMLFFFYIEFEAKR